MERGETRTIFWDTLKGIQALYYGTEGVIDKLPFRRSTIVGNDKAENPDIIDYESRSRVVRYLNFNVDNNVKA